MRRLHVVVPEGIDDPRRPSGGNAYDRRVCRELGAMGWAVSVHPVAGDWPFAAPPARSALAAEVCAIPDGDVVLVDGLVASAAAAVLTPHAKRLRQVVLVHMPLGDDHGGEIRQSESAVLSGAVSVIVTSEWSRGLLLRLYGLPDGRIHVAVPGVDAARLAPGTAEGGELLCVATVTQGKGHDLLVGALGSLTDAAWRCRCVGSLERDPAFVQRLRREADRSGLGERVAFTGACSDAELERLFLSADVLVHPSRSETYGMVVAEALAHGLPVIAAEVGGVPEALGRGRSGVAPGLLVAPDSAETLAGALRAWLGDAGLRRRLRAAALERRGTLGSWRGTAALVGDVCEAAAR